MGNEDQEPGNAACSLELITADDLKEVIGHNTSEVHPDKVWTPEALLIEVPFLSASPVSPHVAMHDS